MGIAKEKTKRVVRHTGRVVKRAPAVAHKIVRGTGRASIRAVKKIPQTKTYQKTRQTYKNTHYKYAYIPHQHLMQTSTGYASWHSWRLKRLHHGHVHFGALILYVFFVGVIVFNHIGYVFAADLSDTWNFSTPADFELSDQLETSGSSVRLKAQEYSSDGNTAALYHLNEASGSTADDASSNNNDVTLHGSPAFGTGNLNNGLTLNGTNQYGETADSASLSMTGQQSLETWIKPDSTFNNSSGRSQSIIDKGSYRLGLDRTTGKAFYEVERNGTQSWTKRLGADQAGSWSFGHTAAISMISSGSDIYVGTGSNTADAEVWKWNGTAWSQIGGDGLRGSWAEQTYETVRSLAINGNALYAGIGDTSGDGEIWTCDLTSNCNTWTKIGGDGIGTGGPAAFTYTMAESMVVYGGNLYVGMAGGAGAGDLFRYNGGTSWTQVAGDGLSGSWAASTFTNVSALYTDGANLYAGLAGSAAGTGDLWKYNGSTWSQIGGDGVNPGGGASWNTNYERVATITSMGSDLYIGLGNSAQDAEVWRLSGTTWSQIGGDGLSGSWNAATYTMVYGLANDGTNLYASTGSGTNAGEVWKWNGSTWTRIGGSGTNSTSNWSTTITYALLWANSKLYTTPGPLVYQYDGSAWSMIGGYSINNSWNASGVTTIASSTTHNGKLYYGLGAGQDTALVYEYDGTSARRIGGGGNDGSWPVWTYTSVTSMASYHGELYVGLSTSGGSNTADVWKWNGSTWTQVGGDGLNSTWNNGERTASSMMVFNDKLYVGLGNAAYFADIWEWNGTAWTQVAGEPGTTTAQTKNGSWNTNPRAVNAMTIYNGQLCVALGGSGTTGEVWCWAGTGNWTKIGGGGLNSGWTNSVAEALSLTAYNGKLYVSLYPTGHTASIWEWNGTAWTQVAGASLNGSWPDSTYTYVKTMAVYNGYLYAGTYFTGSSNPTGDVWRWDGSTWTQVGGDSINNSWSVAENREEVGNLITYKGKLYASTGFSANLDALVYSFGDNAYVESNTSSFSGNTWHHLAGTYDGTTIKLYVDGSLDGTSAAAGSGVDNDRALLIGSSHGLSTSDGGSLGYFSGAIDEVRISNSARSSFTTKPYSDTEQSVMLGSAVRTSGVASWDGLSADEAANGGTLTYRLSNNDGSTWKYWDGDSWEQSAGLNQASSVADINAHIGDFPVTFSGIRWQAVLKGNGSQRVQLDSVTLTANSDTDDPSNASDIEMYKSNGGDQVSGGAWTNASTPYFTWNAGSDGGAGILGYCLYLGTSGSADPSTTKGLLGTSPVNTGGNCQFAVNGTSVDLSTSGYLASALSTSDDSYYLNIKAIDNAGNVSSSFQQFEFKFDNTPPNNPGFITAPSQFVSSKEVTFTWPTVGADAPSDANSGLSGLQYRIGASSSWYGDGTNGAGFLTNDGSYTTRTNPDYANINEGNNTVYFRTWDQAGNVTSSYTTAALKLNTTSPASPQNVEATPSTNTTNSFAFSWSAPATFSGSASAITYCYTINTAPTVNTCTYTTAGVTSLPVGAFATQPGDNTFYVVAKDEAGNINYATAASVNFTANTSAPGIPLDIDIADVSVKSNSSWKLALTWETPSDVGAGIANYKIYRSTDNNNFTQVATTSGTSHVDGGLNQVHYYYKVRACDSANNCGAYSAVVDDTPTGKFTTPATLTAQPAISGVSTKKATIKWATNRNSDSKISLGTKPGEYGPFQVASPTQVTDHIVELANLTPGTTYYAKAVWTDEDGNTGSSSEFIFKTELAPSTQEVITQRVSLSTAQIRFTSVSAAKVVIQYGKTDSFGGVKEISTSLSKSTYDIELGGLEDGTKYYYRLNTFDAEGNEYTGSTVLTFTTPARPRINDLRFQPVEGEPTSTQKITWTTNVPASSLVRFSAENSPTKEVSTSALTTSHEIVVKDLLDDTVYSLVAESRDAGGNLAVSDTQSLRTALDTRPPKISDITVETTIRGTGAEARGQVVVSWKTDEPATSQVAYAEGSDATAFNNKTSEDTALGLEHIVIVSDLPTSRVYTVQPISKDRSDNAGTGESNSAIIGRASDSVMTIILTTLQKVFGF